jgi:hypothetical protein
LVQTCIVALGIGVEEETSVAVGRDVLDGTRVGVNVRLGSGVAEDPVPVVWARFGEFDPVSIVDEKFEAQAVSNRQQTSKQ